MDQMKSFSPTGRALAASFAGADHVTTPFDYWLLSDVLPDVVARDIAALPVAPPEQVVFDGRRETNNQSRIYFTPEMQLLHPVSRTVCDAFNDPRIISAIERMTGTDLGAGRLRIEYTQDTDGFWLEPHTDISVKLFTMLVYLSDDPALGDAGTDIYDATPEHNRVATAPHKRNHGLVFIPGSDTWHGFTKRPINGVRKSLIINYVAPEWRDTWELA